MPVIDFFGNCRSYVGQTKKTICIDKQKAAFPQDADRMTDAGLGETHVSGKVNGTHHTFLLFDYQHSFQIIFTRRMDFFIATS